MHVMSPQEVIRDKGRDPDEVLEEIAEWQQLLQANKLEANNGEETQN